MQDELLWGASWLHQASEDASYMSYIQSNGHTLGAEDDDYSFSWDDKRVGTKVLLSKVYLKADSNSLWKQNDSWILILVVVTSFLQGFLQDRIEGLQLYKVHADSYICSLVPGTSSFQAQYTPGQVSSHKYVTFCSSNEKELKWDCNMSRGASLQRKWEQPAVCDFQCFSSPYLRQIPKLQWWIDQLRTYNCHSFEPRLAS